MFSNQKTCENLGYTMAELLEKTVFDIDPTMSPEDWSALWLRVTEKRMATFEAMHRRKDGSAFPVKVTTEPIEIDNSPFAIFYVTEDTHRKQIEKELSLYRFSIDMAPTGIFRSGPDGRILDVNDKACEHLGYGREELCKMYITDIDPTLSINVRNSLWDEMCAKGNIDFETVHRRKDGTTFPVNVTCNQFEHDGSRYAISIARDITQKKKAQTQKELIEKQFRQAQKMESLGTLARGVAHDFNNILSAIYGYAELAQLRCKAHSKMRQYIDQITTASIRAKNLIKQILLFSRQGESEKQNIDIGIVIQETLKLIQATLPSTIEIKQGIQSGLGEVFADDSQIHQILMNLCTNAYHAMQEHGGLLEVDLDRVTIGTYDSEGYPVISPGNYLKLTVSDTGTGIPSSLLSRIYEPYFSTKQSGVGTGMGLSTVLGIVEDHGGSIKVNSLQGVGTVFQVFFPLVAAAATDQPIEETGDATILIVDDESLLLNIKREYLEDMGYSVVTMENPVDAIKTIRLNPEKFDLVITDLTMPQMTGDNLAREIKKALPEMPIIMCTGFDSTGDLDRLKKMGISHLLMKPINLLELDNVIRKMLN